MYKKCINVLLLLVLLIQILPVEQLGAALFNNVFTEEIAHHISFDDIEGKKFCNKNNFIHNNTALRIISFVFDSSSTIFFKAIIPHNYSTEILVPPPNC